MSITAKQEILNWFRLEFYGKNPSLLYAYNPPSVETTIDSLNSTMLVVFKRDVTFLLNDIKSLEMVNEHTNKIIKNKLNKLF